MKFNIENRPFFVCIVLSIISMKYFSVVLMLITLLASAILAMDGFKKYAIYSAIHSLICGISGLIMNTVVEGFSNKVDLVTAYPSLVNNPADIHKLHMIFNVMRFSQIGFILLIIVIDIIVIKFYGYKLKTTT